MSYRNQEHHNPDEARLYEYDPFTDTLTQGMPGAITNAGQPIGSSPAGTGGSGLGNPYGGLGFGDEPADGPYRDRFGDEYYIQGNGLPTYPSGHYYRDQQANQPQQYETGSDSVGDYYINEHGIKVYSYRYPTGGGGGTAPISYGEPYIDPLTGKVVQRDSRGNISVVGSPTGAGGSPMPSYTIVTAADGNKYYVSSDPNEPARLVQGLPPEAAGTVSGGVNKQSVVIGGQAYTFDPATGQYTKAEGIGTAANNPYDPSKGAQGMSGGQSSGDAGLTRALASIASAQAKAEAEANRAFQREQLAAEQAYRDGQLAIQQGQLDLARQQFAAAERHQAEADKIAKANTITNLASHLGQAINSTDPLYYSTVLAGLDGGQGPFTNLLSQGQNFVTDASNTDAALTLQSLRELQNPSGTSTGGTGASTTTSTGMGGGSGLGRIGRGGRYGAPTPRPGAGSPTPSGPRSTTPEGMYQVEDPNRPGVQLMLNRSQLTDLVYSMTNPAPNPQTGARINETTSIGGPMFANGQSSYVDNAGTFVSRTGAAGVPLDSTYTNGGETLTPAAQAGLNQIDPATGLMKDVPRAAYGGQPGHVAMIGDSTAADPWAGGARPEIAMSAAPISVIPSDQSRQMYQSGQVAPQFPQTATMAMGGLSRINQPMGGSPMPMSAQQYRQQYRPAPDPIAMPRFAWGTQAFRPKTSNRAPSPSPSPSAPGPTGPITTQPVTPTPTSGSGSNGGIDGLTGITPGQSYLDQVNAYRQGAQGPDLNFFDVGYNLLDPTYRDVGLMKLQGKYGVPVASAQALQQRYALAGGPQYGGY